MLSPRGLLQYFSYKVSSPNARGRCGLPSTGTVMVSGREWQSQRGFKWTGRVLTNLGERHCPSPTDKKMLVWAKIYKSIEEVPDEVSFTQMRKARDWARIRVNLWMAAATVVGCIVVIGYAKSRQGSGDSLRNRGLKWENEMREKGREERMKKEG